LEHALRAKSGRGHAAATAFCHSAVASARKIRRVEFPQDRSRLGTLGCLHSRAICGQQRAPRW
jgi:hypothetical protein